MGNLVADPKTYNHITVTDSVSFFPNVLLLILTNANLETGFRKTGWLHFSFKEKRSYFLVSSRTAVFRKINYLQQLVPKKNAF